MFKIGEFSKLTQISIRMLRYYDEEGLLKPAFIDPYTGYRMYSSEQIPTINKIIFLRDLGFDLSEISSLILNWNNISIQGLLEQKRNEIEKKIEQEKAMVLAIEQAKIDLKKEKIDINCQVTIKSIPKYQVLSLRRTVNDYYCEGELWQELASYAKDKSIIFSEECFTIYYDAEYKDNGIDMEICTLVNELGKSDGDYIFRVTDALPIAACAMVYGDFKNISGAFKEIADWLTEHIQYKMLDGNRQIVHRGPWNEADPENYLTEIQIPLEKIY